MKRFVSASLIVPMLLMAFVAGCSRAPDVVKIGIGQPLSGDSREQGEDMLRGAMLAIDHINEAGGIKLASGRVRLEGIARDDRGEPGQGVIVAKELVAQDVVAAIAHLNSGVSIAAAPIYAKAGTPQMAISTKGAYTRLNLPTTLRLVANDDLQARALGLYATQLPDSARFAVLDDSSAYAKGLATDAAGVIVSKGRQVPVRLSVPGDATDFQQAVADIGRHKVDVVVAVLSDTKVKVLVEQLAAARLTHLRIIGGDGIKTDALRGVVGKLRAVYATSPILEPREFLNGEKFLSAFRARYRGGPAYAAHYAYDAIHLIADALARNGTADRTALLNRLKHFDGHAPVTGAMRFRDDGEQRYGAVAVYQLRNEGWVPLVRSDQW